MKQDDAEAPGPVDLSAAVTAAVAGDEDAFGVLYNEVQPGLLRYLRVLVGQDAEDVASETWLQIARDIRWYAGKTTRFREWAATAAHRRATAHLRHTTRTTPVEDLDCLPGHGDTETQAVNSVTTDAAIALIGSLPREQAEAVLLRVVVGLDAKAAGRVLGKRAGAVRTAAHRGLRQLARKVQKETTWHTDFRQPAADQRTARPHRATPDPATVVAYKELR